jgi:phosphoethanolamine N-methyltransferase
MHIPDKPRLFARLRELLSPGGRLVITDYARGKSPGSPEFERYIEKTGYHVIEPKAYGELLRAARFTDVVVDDATKTFVEILESEMHRLDANRADFLASFTEADLNYLVDRWAMKVRFCNGGDMKWGIYLATRQS